MKNTNNQLVNLAAVCPSLILDIIYATANNFFGCPVYSKAVCFLHAIPAKALVAVQEELSFQGLGLKVYDGYRPLSIQQLMWERVQDERYISNPAVNRGRHPRGTAVDVTLVDRIGQELEMPSGFDEFSERAHSNYDGGPKAALQNRKLLSDVMQKHGFQVYPFEWWHFDYQGWQDDLLYPSLDIPLDYLEP